MTVQVKIVQATDHLIDKTNEELLKLGDKVIDVEIHKEDSYLTLGGGYSIIKYNPNPVTQKTVLNESNKQ